MVKSTLREIRTSLTRYLAIFAIVALGVGFYSGLKITRDCMVKTASEYLNDKNYYDYQINSSYGIDDESIRIAESWDGVSGAEGSVQMDVLVKAGDGDSKALRAISMPEDINELNLVEGRLPEKEDECVIDAISITDAGFNIGDRLVITDENDRDRLKDFRIREFTIVGTVNSPLYMDYQRGFTEIGNGSLSAFFFIDRKAFDVDYYTDMYVKLDAVRDYFSNDVENNIADILDENKDSTEDLSEAVTAARREEEQRKAQEELDEKVQEYEDGVAEYEENRAKAEEEFAKAEKKIADGQKQIDSGLEKAEKGRSDAINAINELNAKLAEVNAGIDRLNGERQKAEEGLARATEGRAQLTEAKAGLEAKTEELKQKLAEEEAKPEEEQDPELIEELKGQIAELEMQTAAMEEQIKGLDAQIEEINAGIAVIDSNLAEAESGKAQIESGLSQAYSGLKQAEDGISKIKKEQKKLNAGKKELRSQEIKAETEFRKAEEKLKDVNDVLKEAQQKIDEMAAGDSYAVPSTKNPGYSSFDSNSDIVERVAFVFPVFFFLIAALVVMTTMTRMIDEQRGQVGILKALGYSNAAIAGKYLFYSGSAAFLGAVIGFFAGCRIFPVVIWKAYGMLYDFSEDVAYVIDPKLALVSIAAALVCSMGATWISIASDFRSAPAELIRPKTPPAGKRILLERITPIWNRVSFLYKVSIRNIFRDKKRFLMMVIGISGCTALLIAGAGIGTTVSQVADHQFEEISLYDYMAVFSKDMDAEKRADFEEALSESGRPADVLYMHQGEVTIVMDKEDAEATCIAAYPDNFGKFVDLHTGEEAIEYPGEGEVVIVKRLMRDFGIKAGDEMLIRDGKNEMKVRVSAVADNYINDIIYMSPETYEHGFGVKPDMKAAYVKLSDDAGEDAVRASATAAAGWEDTAAVQLSQDVKDNVANMMKSLNAVTAAIYLSAALLAFIVIYNLTNINITERTREIATIKVLGFRQLEVTKYVFRENLFMTAVAAVVGVFLGKALLSFAIDSIVIKMLCFETKVSGYDIAKAVILTFVFAVIVGLAMQKRLRDVSMTESLKSVE